MKNSDWWIPRSVLPPCLSNFVLFSYASFTLKTEQKSPSIFAGEEIRKKGKIKPRGAERTIYISWMGHQSLQDPSRVGRSIPSA